MLLKSIFFIDKNLVPLGEQKNIKINGAHGGISQDTGQYRTGSSWMLLLMLKNTGSFRRNGKSKSVWTGVIFHKKWFLRSVLGWEIAANLPYRASGTITITVQRPYAHMPIFGHMQNTWPNEVSLKRASKMQLREVDIRSGGISIQKLEPNNFLQTKSLVFYITKLKKSISIFLDLAQLSKCFKLYLEHKSKRLPL